jgi:hypothetical protein
VPKLRYRIAVKAVALFFFESLLFIGVGMAGFFISFATM